MKKLLLPICVLALSSSAHAFGFFGDDAEEMFRTMHQMMSSMLTRGMCPQVFMQSGSMRQNMQETDEAIIIKIAAPGMSEEAFKIEVLEECLRVSGEQKQGDKNSVSSSSFTQSFSLPVPVKADATVASYDAGILTITMPKHEKAKPHTVAVKVSRPLKKAAQED